jgi:heme exporter protein C
MYVHVPAAWSTLLCFTAAFVCALGWLFRGRWGWDAALEATMEVGVVLGATLLALGSIWARPTWGVWWDWDPRLTSAAVMEVSFIGIIALRSFVDDPEQRARWSSVATILAYVDVPIVYFSVKWWKTLHQPFSSPQTVDSAMVLPLRINAFAFLFIAIWFVARRWRLAYAERRREVAPPPAVAPSLRVVTEGRAS